MKSRRNSCQLNQQLFDLSLKCFDLGFELWAFITSDRTGDHLTGDTTRAAQRVLRQHENVGNVLIFAKEWQMEKDFDGLGVSRHHNQFRQITIQCFRGYNSKTIVDQMSIKCQSLDNDLFETYLRWRLSSVVYNCLLAVRYWRSLWSTDCRPRDRPLDLLH